MDIVIFFHPGSNRFLLSSPPLIFLLVERGEEEKKNVDRFKCSEDGNGRRQCAKIVRRKYPVAREREEERGMVSRSSGNRGIKKGGIKSGTIVVLEFF